MNERRCRSSTLTPRRSASAIAQGRPGRGMSMDSKSRSSPSSPPGSAGGSSPAWPISRERIAFCRLSFMVRPIAITSPTLFICVVSTLSALGNFSKVKRGIFVTT